MRYERSSVKLTRIDELYLDQYFYLESEDRCWFLREYSSGEGWSFSETNDLISNLKKGVVEDRLQIYRQRSVQFFASELATVLGPLTSSRGFTFVPIPPSKTRAHVEYDDRLIRVLEAIPGSQEFDIRELIEQKQDLPRTHRAARRHSSQSLYHNYKINDALREPAPKCLVIFDDLLTTGAHFKAAQRILQETFPAAAILGIFLARAIHQDSRASDVPNP